MINVCVIEMFVTTDSPGAGSLLHPMHGVLHLVHSTGRLIVFFVLIEAAYAAHLVAFVGIGARFVHLLFGRVLGDVLLHCASADTSHRSTKH